MDNGRSSRQRACDPSPICGERATKHFSPRVAWNIAGRDLEPKIDWIVISATYLVGLYLEHDPFEAFRAIEPTARPTPALFVYDASRPDVKKALAIAFDRK